MEIQGPQKFSIGSQMYSWVIKYWPRKNSPLQLILATKISTPTWPFVQQRIFQFFPTYFWGFYLLHCIALHCYCMVLHERHLILFPFFHVPAFVGGGRIWPNRILLQLTRSFFKYQIFLDFSWTIQFWVQFQDISLMANLIHMLHLLLREVSTNLVTHVKIVVTQGVDIHHPLYLLRDLSSFRGSMPGPWHLSMFRYVCKYRDIYHKGGLYTSVAWVSIDTVPFCNEPRAGISGPCVSCAGGA